MAKVKCPDCEAEIQIDNDVKNGDVYSCPCCGLELEYLNGTLKDIELVGEDWGELIGLFKLKGPANSYREWKRTI